MGNTLISKRITVDGSDQGDYSSHTFTLGSWSMANSATLQNSGSPTADAAVQFKVAQATGDNSQARLYVEVYGSDAAKSESITPAYEYTTI